MYCKDVKTHEGQSVFLLGVCLYGYMRLQVLYTAMTDTLTILQTRMRLPTGSVCAYTAGWGQPDLLQDHPLFLLPRT